MKPDEITILTVDDNPSNIRLLTHYMEKEGYNVITAEDGFEGFKAAIKYHPDLILLDIMMPGTDGYEVCELLKTEEETREIPVIFLTAKAEAEDKIKGFEMGAVDYIIKPFNLIEVSTRVKHHLKVSILGKQNELLKSNFFNFLTEFNQSAGTRLFCKYSSKLLASLGESIKKVQDLKDLSDTQKKKFRASLKEVQGIEQFCEKNKPVSEENTNQEIFHVADLIDDIIYLLSLDVYEFINIKLKDDNPDVILYGKREIISLILIHFLYNISLAYDDDVDINISLAAVSLPKDLQKEMDGEIKEKYARITIQCISLWDEKEELIMINPLFLQTKIEKNIGTTVTATKSLTADIGGAVDFELNNDFTASLYFPIEES